MSSAPTHRLTAEEYLAIERKAETKSELIHGRMYAMSGASLAHIRITSNLVGAFRDRLKGRDCDVLVADMRVKVADTGMYTYPDVSIVCEQPKLEDSHFDTLLNPLVIVEVLSASTEAYDRGAKFAHYRRLASLQAYVLVSQREPTVECFVRTGDGWTLTSATGLDAAIDIAPLGCTLQLSDVYERVSFEEETKAP